eukprot:934854-Amphidinium_carterae.1
MPKGNAEHHNTATQNTPNNGKHMALQDEETADLDKLNNQNKPEVGGMYINGASGVLPWVDASETDRVVRKLSVACKFCEVRIGTTVRATIDQLWVRKWARGAVMSCAVLA